jgi:hypothetical protein
MRVQGGLGVVVALVEKASRPPGAARRARRLNTGSRSPM